MLFFLLDLSVLGIEWERWRRARWLCGGYGERDGDEEEFASLWIIGDENCNRSPGIGLGNG